MDNRDILYGYVRCCLQMKKYIYTLSMQDTFLNLIKQGKKSQLVLDAIQKKETKSYFRKRRKPFWMISPLTFKCQLEDVNIYGS